MRPTLLIDTLVARTQAHMAGIQMRPAFIRGEPGGGKTQTVRYVADRLEIGFVHLHGPTMLAEDFGIPIPDGTGRLRFALSDDKFPFDDSDTIPEDFGIINIDEMAAMGTDQQKIIANLIQERELHGRKLKPGWMFVATGNRMEDRAGAVRILSHLNDRYTTYDYEVNTDDWVEWALTRGKVAPEVVAFLQFRPDLLAKFDANADKSPTPRGWSEGVSRSVGVVPPGALFESIAGDVGKGAATEFVAFNETYTKLPDPDLVLQQAATYHVPDEAHIKYALIGALVHRVDVDNFPAFLTYVSRMDDAFMVMAVRNAITAKPETLATQAYNEWAASKGAKALLGR